MAVAGQVTAKFTADVAEYITATEKLKNQNQGIGKSTDDLAKRLKKSLGEESGLGQIGKLLTGAGVVAGVTVIGNVLANASARAVELKNQFQQGQISAGEMADELAKAVPVLGKFWEFGRNIRELFTGEEFKDAAMAQSITATYEITRKASDATEQWARNLEKVRNVLPRNVARANEGPLTRGFTDLASNFFDTRADIFKTWRDNVQATIAPINEQIQKNRDLGVSVTQLVALRKQAIAAAIQERDALLKNNQALTNAGMILAGLGNVYRAAGNELANPISAVGGAWARLQTQTRPIVKFFDDWAGSVERAKVEAAELHAQLNKMFGDKVRSMYESLTDAARAWADENKRLAEQAMTPLERYQRTMADLDKRRALGPVFGIDEKTFKAAADRAQKDLADAMAARPAAALTAAPQLSAQFSTNQSDIPAKQLDEQKKTTAGINKLFSAVKDAYDLVVITR